MELCIFGRYVSKPGEEERVAAALRKVLAETRKEPGSVSVQICQSEEDPREFRIFSHWRDGAAFDQHFTLPHVVEFSHYVEPLVVEGGLIRSRRIDV